MSPHRAEERAVISTPRRRAGWRRAPIALAAAAAVTLGLTSVVAPPTASAAPDGAKATRPSDPNRVGLPGLTGDSHVVTLPTGDRITLTGGAGHYTVQATAAPGTDSVVTVHATTTPAGVTDHITADTSDTWSLVRTGIVDRNLFDVTWLMAHGDTTPAATLPITIRYSASTATAAAARHAEALPGATVTHASGRTVSVAVPARKAAAFWRGLTGRAEADGAVPVEQLAGGAVRVWPTGHRSTAARPAATGSDGAPLFTVTVVEKKSKGGFTAGCYRSGANCIGPVYLSRINSRSFDSYQPLGAACVDEACTQVVWKFSVPAGTYEADGSYTQHVGNRRHYGTLVDPEFAVAGDTTTVLDADRVVPLGVDTPRPTEAYSQNFSAGRTTIDGAYGAGLTFPSYGTVLEWLPTTSPVTFGTFHVSTLWQLGTPSLTMKVTAPTKLALHAFYPHAYETVPGDPFTRFDGRQALQVVDAGVGDQADFDRIDARGKLALVRARNGFAGPTRDDYAAASAAGAAGILIDPTNTEDPSLSAEIPVFLPWGGLCDTLPCAYASEIPSASISVAEAAQVRKLLAGGPVTVAVADGGATPYLYNLRFTDEGGFHRTGRYSVTDPELTRVTERYHAPGGSISTDWSAFRPNENLVTGIGYYRRPAPATTRMYYGPATPDQVWTRSAAGTRANAGPTAEFTRDVFTPGVRETDWLGALAAPATIAPPTDVYAAQPEGKWTDSPTGMVCSLCRTGDWFFPYADMVPGAAPRDWGVQAFDAGSMHLYRSDGTEVPLTTHSYADAYQLPPEKRKYRFTASVNGIASEWTFTSARPGDGDYPTGYECLDWAVAQDERCAANPILFLRYDGHTDVHDSVTASAGHRLTITPTHQLDPGAVAPLASLKVWTSVDGGTSWSKAALGRDRDGAYTAHYRVPGKARTDGYVSIKVVATDTAGATLTQTLTDTIAVS